jgi:hypothetical protein
MSGTSKSTMLSMREVAAHNTAEDCWVVIFGVVYDLSEFHKTHPGGGAIITNNAGKVRQLLLLFVQAIWSSIATQAVKCRC